MVHIFKNYKKKTWVRGRRKGQKKEGDSSCSRSYHGITKNDRAMYGI